MTLFWTMRCKPRGSLGPLFISIVLSLDMEVM